MAGGTQLANVLDSIPYFETTGERDARFPSPDLRQRAQVGDVLYQWNGSAWVLLPWSETRLVPSGGSAGQVLRKASGTDYDTQWAAVPGDSIDIAIVAGATLSARIANAISLLPSTGGTVDCRGLSVSASNTLTAKVTVPDNVTILGSGRGTTHLYHAYNGPMFELGDGASLKDLRLVGQGATYSGRAIEFLGTAGRQQLENVMATDFEDEVLYFELGAGSQCYISNCRLSRRSAGTGTGRYAIVIEDDEQLSAVPRKFVGIETDGQCAFHFGGSNNTFVVASFLGDLAFSDDSRGVNISSCRIANQVALTVLGAGNSIVACDIAPQVTLGAGADAITIGPGAYNNLPIIDNSGTGRNNITHWATAFTPVFTAGGGSPAVGDGALTGEYSQAGSQVTATINFAVGSTTNLGSGELRFSLPVPCASALVQVIGRALINDSGTLYEATAQLAATGTYFTLIRDTSGSVTGASPATLGNGDAIRVTVVYNT